MKKPSYIVSKKTDILDSDIVRYNYYASCDGINQTCAPAVIDSFKVCDKITEILSQNNNSIDVSDVFKNGAKQAWIFTGGWQSWAPGFELSPEEERPFLRNYFIPQFSNYILFPGTKKKYDKKKFVQAQFISYVRINDTYFVMASTGCVTDRNPVTFPELNKAEVTAPVQYVINRRNLAVEVQVHDTGKEWKENDLIAQVCFFVCNSYSGLKEKIEFLFGSSDAGSKNYTKRFDSLKFLGKRPAGWESWYNHYSRIDQKLIEEDLESLTATENVLSLSTIANKEPCVFQVDDGWEEALGDWQWRKDRFPLGPQYITSQINKKEFIPGLWIAPFIIDLRSNTAKKHPDWILKNKKGKPVAAGFNPLWGAQWGKDQPGLPCTFHCLDLSNKEVLKYLDKLINTAINTWGFRYLKLDFLYAGMLIGEYKEGGAAFEHYNNAVKILTKRKKNNKGEPVAYLGCGMPFEHSFNDFPLSRSGCDTLEHWDDPKSANIGWMGRTSAYLNMKDSIGREFWNRKIFWCDPDVIFIRKVNCSLNKKEKLLVAGVASMFGNQFMYSDDPERSKSDEEVALAKEIIEQDKKLYGKNYSIKPLVKDVWEVRDEQSVRILNLSDEDTVADGITITAHSMAEL
ncbi:MAG: alpha-galactosidase [Treponema sp.]|nr:alpha-galactosidase [Treponema sp.]